MSISRSALQGSQVQQPLVAALTTTLADHAHPLRSVPVFCCGSQREGDETASASLVFSPDDSDDETISLKVTTSTANYGIIALTLAEYQHILGKKVAPLDYELESTPDLFEHKLGHKPAMVLGVMLEGNEANGSVLVFDPVLSTSTHMRIGHTAAGAAMWRLLPLTQTRYNEIIGKVTNPVLRANDLSTTPVLVEHKLPNKPSRIYGCQVYGDVLDGSQLVYDLSASDDVNMSVHCTAGSPDWLICPFAGRHLGA